MSTKICWIYEKDEVNKNRFVLGIKGNAPLVCIGVNPSTAEPDILDNTIKSVVRIAEANRVDSWLMLNLSPQIATNPNHLDQNLNQEVHKRNLDYIEKVFKNKDILLCASWGNLIHKRDYLTQCLTEIVDISRKYNQKWHILGEVTTHGNPRHPLYLSRFNSVNEFDMESYIQKLKD